MIVLDSASKSLTVEAGSGTGGYPAATTAVVAYWSIDSAGLWTPHSYEVQVAPGGIPVTTTILSAPAGSEVARVVENVWIYFPTALVASQYLKVQFDTSGTKRGLAYIDFSSTTAFQANMVLVLKRDGLASRQYPGFTGGSTTSPLSQVVN